MKGILFKSDMLEAIRQGNKTVTRRLDNLKIINQEPEAWYFVTTLNHGLSFGFGYKKHYSEVIVKPRFRVGEVAFVREKYMHFGNCYNAGKKFALVKYSDGICKTIELTNPPEVKCGHASFKSPLFMPEWAARHFIKILDVRTERVQEITEEDVVLEGIADIGAGDLRGMYAVLWGSLSPKFPWSSNPWCWRYQFEKTERPK